MNLLIVCPAFPPFSGVGGMRMASLSKYIRDLGNRVVIIRNDPNFWGADKLKAEVPQGMEIIDVNACYTVKKNGDLYYKTIEKAIHKTCFDLIIFSVGPFYTLRAALRINKQYHIPYIIDFRDLWVFENRGDRGFINNMKHALLRNLHRLEEKKAIKYANAVITVTPEDQNTMRMHYKKYKDKFYTVYNGFDDIDVQQKRIEKKSDVVELVSLGKIGYYSTVFVDILFEAVDTISRLGRKVAITHVGEPETYARDLAKSGRYQNLTYNCTGYLSYKQGIQIAKNADICFIACNHPTGLGTKVFDYIACNRPIILLTKQSRKLAELVSSFKHGYVCETVKDIQRAINEIIENNIQTLDDDINLHQYSRKRQNKNYYDIIQSLF